MHNAQRLPGATSSGGPQLKHVSSDTLVAGILAFLLAVPSGLSVSISVGGVIALIMAPVTFPALWRNKSGRLILIALVALVPSGWLVGQISLLQDPNRSLNTGIFQYEAAMPVGLLASILGAYWCVTKLGLQRFLLLSCTGLLAAAPFLPWFVHGAWKYALALPVSILVILLLARNRLLLGFVITPLLVAVSIAGDYRSWIVFLALATVLTAYTPANSKNLSASGIASLGFMTAACVSLVGWLIVSAATSGALGDYLEQRTNQQLADSNGNLLLGGRPEWGAAFALWRKSPLGIGFGVAPSSDDYWTAVRSMPLRPEAQENSVVAFYFRQGQVDFHSTLWTFWGVYSAAGVLFAVLSLVYLVHSTALSTRAISGVALRASVLLFTMAAIWGILFSPTNVPQLAIALAIALYIRATRTPHRVEKKDFTYESVPTH